MIKDMSDNGKIYKYYPCNKYSFNVLKDNQLFFSRPSNFNDPFDSSGLLVKPYKKFCDSIGLENIDEIFEKQGICCFTKSDKPDNKHFWSLYAGNYSGFALEFDEDELNSVYAPLHLEKVHYFNNPMNLDNCKNTFSTNQSDRIYTVKECIDEFTNPVECNPEPLDRLFQYLHLYKEKKIWGNENEYRMIIGNSSRNPRIPVSKKIHPQEKGDLFDLCPNAIKSITLGYKMSPDDMKEIYKIKKETGIPIYEATPDIVSQWTVTIKPI